MPSNRWCFRGGAPISYMEATESSHFCQGRVALEVTKKHSLVRRYVMRSYRTLIMLAVVLAALAVPVCITVAAPKPKAVVDAGVIAPALTVFPDTKYNNAHTQEAYDMGATGSFIVEQAAMPNSWLFSSRWLDCYRMLRTEPTSMETGSLPATLPQPAPARWSIPSRQMPTALPTGTMKQEPCPWAPTSGLCTSIRSLTILAPPSCP